MYAENITPAQVKRAARTAGLRPVNVRASGNGLRFTLKTHGPTSTGQPVRFGRLSRYADRRTGRPKRIPGAVCWHGFRAFFRAAYELAPGATFTTALATYTGAAHFEDTHAATENVPSYRTAPGPTPCDCIPA